MEWIRFRDKVPLPGTKIFLNYNYWNGTNEIFRGYVDPSYFQVEPKEEGPRVINKISLSILKNIKNHQWRIDDLEEPCQDS